MLGFEELFHGQAEHDGRILRAQLEHRVDAIRGMVFGSPIWAVVVAFLSSPILGSFGNAQPSNCFAFIGVAAAAALVSDFVLRRYYRFFKKIDTPAAVNRWLAHFLKLQVLSSTVWGIGAWLLWDPDNRINHVFLGLASLSVVARFLMNRAGRFEFFIASFAPMALLLFVRYITAPSVTELVLALLVPAYAFQLAYDGRHLSSRVGNDIRLRFANEDMARELEEARDEALHKRFEAETANASKTAFLANMSHELRTPLNAILGFSEIIARECLGAVGNARYKEYAGDIHTSGSHLLSLINDLLDVAKIEAGRMEIEPHMVETKRAIDSALKFVSVRARERHQDLVIAVDPSAATLYADERALKQIVINLVSNSVKFTPDGGRITVDVRRNSEGEFLLSVEDTGHGIPKEKLDRVFLPFSQLDNRYDRQAGGTGLGLALVRGLVELHGGRAWIESEEGKGTRVSLTLPAQQEAGAQRASA